MGQGENVGSEGGTNSMSPTDVVDSQTQYSQAYFLAHSINNNDNCDSNTRSMKNCIGGGHFGSAVDWHFIVISSNTDIVNSNGRRSLLEDSEGGDSIVIAATSTEWCRARICQAQEIKNLLLLDNENDCRPEFYSPVQLQETLVSATDQLQELATNDQSSCEEEDKLIRTLARRLRDGVDSGNTVGIYYAPG